MFDPSLKVENEVLGTCSKCGLQLRHAMYYVCVKDNCPSGLGHKVKMSDYSDWQSIETSGQGHIIHAYPLEA